ncbi:hypothetical protein GIS00_23190 [Nakamurella sp. YIM 132087]|uniref:Uncharacterized protein n=1 Tax=Nakamurella alba TaxID=2665158 RepID=A0A7K1FUG8_9ACTN|nr:hypothetical protein [Nakamurella alba]MTD16843.1 hypothetical protein [Nakamurella alba]
MPHSADRADDPAGADDELPDEAFAEVTGAGNGGFLTGPGWEFGGRLRPPTPGAAPVIRYFDTTDPA